MELNTNHGHQYLLLSCDTSNGKDKSVETVVAYNPTDKSYEVVSIGESPQTSPCSTVASSDTPQLVQMLLPLPESLSGIEQTSRTSEA